MGNLAGHLVYEPTGLLLALHRMNLAAAFGVVLLCYGLAGLLFARRKQDGMALFMAYYLVFHGLLFGGPIEMLDPIWSQASAVNSFVLMPLINLPMTMILLAIFPDGHFVPRWTRWVLWAVFVMEVIAGGSEFMLLRYPSDLYVRLIAATAAAWPAVIAALVGAQIYRYRHVSSRMQRQQTKWVMYGFLVMIGLFVVGGGPWFHALSLPNGSRMPWWVSPVESTWILSVAVVPIALTISVLRYRLYDVDVLINRTLVFGALSAFVIGAYALVVGGMSMLFQSSGSLIFSLVATGFVAVLFHPLRQRLQRAVNRLLYGDRDEPFVVMRRLGERLESSGVPAEMLTGIVETVVQALKLPYAQITLERDDGRQSVADHGERRGALTAFAIPYQGETIGFLNVALRGPGESLTESDQRLLRHIARQAGPVAHTMRLTQNLRQSRALTVTAREEERRRLRRDLHDGLGPVLASQGLKIEAVSHLMRSDPERAEQMLNELADQNEAAVAEIRRLVYALRPPELDELGLVGAVADYAAGLNVNKAHGTEFRLDVQQPNGDLPPLPAAVEVAAYRIVTEALTNVTRHAEARQCTVSLRLDDGVHGRALRMEIVDDGVGFPRKGGQGIGLSSMFERAQEVGGNLRVESAVHQGTRVIGRFPLAGL